MNMTDFSALLSDALAHSENPSMGKPIKRGTAMKAVDKRNAQSLGVLRQRSGQGHPVVALNWKMVPPCF